MTARSLAYLIGAGRILVGVLALLAPERLARPWIGAGEAAKPSSRALARALGVRDLLLGAATIASVDAGGDPRRWLAAGVVADGVDFAATVAERDIPLRNRAFITLIAGGTAAAEAAALVVLPAESATAEFPGEA